MHRNYIQCYIKCRKAIIIYGGEQDYRRFIFKVQVTLISQQVLKIYRFIINKLTNYKTSIKNSNQAL